MEKREAGNENIESVINYQIKRAKDYLTEHQSHDGCEDTLECCIISDLLRIARKG